VCLRLGRQGRSHTHDAACEDKRQFQVLPPHHSGESQTTRFFGIRNAALTDEQSFAFRPLPFAVVYRFVQCLDILEGLKAWKIKDSRFWHETEGGILSDKF